MTKKRTPAVETSVEPVAEETLEEPVIGEDEQDPGEIEISLKTDPSALMLPECELHHFEFLRTAKVMGNRTPEGTRYRRIDTFFCTGCLRYTTVAREEVERIKPEWFMGN